ncbi:MAG: GNAT family N-acetyltransferase [Sulfitobacter sp.]|nr:GNAT family N-acetyltransferase [Sulfitobacter sp.]
MSGPQILQATTPDDIEAVRDLCWQYRTFLLGNSEIDRQITETFYPVEAYARLMDELPQAHARPRGTILLVRDENGTPLGCGMSHGLDSDRAEIKRLFVTEATRGKGLAKSICKALMDQARLDGYGRILLDTSCTLTAAQSLYDGLGFVRRGPYQPVGDDMLPLLVFFERTL